MSDSPQLCFEDCLSELERIVNDLEDGTLGLEESLQRYERGVGLLKQCYAQLRQAEQRIQLLIDVDGDGQPQLEPFEHTATAEQAKPPARKRTRPPTADDALPFQ